jgi:hypothetical protein
VTHQDAENESELESGTGAGWSKSDYPYMCLVDRKRTLAFQRAISTSVKPGDIVVEVGAGTGILSLFAASAGAITVHAIEIDALLAAALRRTAKANGFGGVIQVMEGDIRNVPLPEAVDVVIMEMIETGLFEESQAEVINLLHDRRVIGPNTKVIPSRYETFAELVHVDREFYGYEIHAPIHDWPFYDAAAQWEQIDITPLTRPESIGSFDFQTGPVCRMVQETVPFDVIDSGVINAVRVSGLVTLSEGEELGACNSLNGDKLISLSSHPAEAGESTVASVSYVAGQGLEGFELTLLPRVTARRRAIRALSNQLPTFPEMAELGIEHLSRIRELTVGHDSYSDFTPTGMWAWNSAGRYRVAELRGNLVIETGDYLTAERFLSFIGSYSVSETAIGLLDAAHSDPFLNDQLLLVPEIVVDLLSGEGSDQFVFTESPEHRDYLYDPRRYISMAGGQLRRIRQHLAAYERAIGEHGPLQIVTGSGDLLKDRSPGLADMYDRWLQTGSEGSISARSERIAFEHLISTVHELEHNKALVVLIAESEKDIRWCSISELLDDRWAMQHFAKSDGVYAGADTAQFIATIGCLRDAGVRVSNMQQDLGIDGLRQHKSILRPVGFLKKFSVGVPDPSVTRCVQISPG